MIMPALLLQKPHAASKSHDHVACLKCRLVSRQDGDIDNLMRECSSHKDGYQRIARTFNKLMFQGKVRAALRVISVEGKGSSLPLDSIIPTNEQQSTTVREELVKKHPPGRPANGTSLVPPNTQTHNVHPVLFDCIDGDGIRNAAIHTNGSAGPSGLDANGWKSLCTSFQNSSSDLCNSLALVARRLCTTYIDPAGLTAVA